MQLELSDGQTAELRDPLTLRKKDRDAFVKTLPDLPIDAAGQPIPGSEMGFGMSLFDHVLAYVVESWSLTDDAGDPLPLPSVDLASLGELTIPEADILERAAKQYMDILVPNFGVNPDPASPTRPSNA